MEKGDRIKTLIEEKISIFHCAKAMEQDTQQAVAVSKGQIISKRFFFWPRILPKNEQKHVAY